MNIQFYFCSRFFRCGVLCTFFFINRFHYYLQFTVSVTLVNFTYLKPLHRPQYRVHCKKEILYKYRLKSIDLGSSCRCLSFFKKYLQILLWVLVDNTKMLAGNSFLSISSRVDSQVRRRVEFCFLIFKCFRSFCGFTETY